MLSLEPLFFPEIVILVLALSSLQLHFFGRKKSLNTKQQLASADDGFSQAKEQRVEKLRDRTRFPFSQRLVPVDKLEKSRKELRTFLLEKELASAALTRLYEAEASGQITKEEREILAVKYREELKALDSKIAGIDALVEVGDLETLRDQLLRLVNEKIDAIDRRIERTKIAVSPLIQETLSKPEKASVPLESQQGTKEKPTVPDISDLLSTKPEISVQGTSLPQASPPETQAITEPVVPSQVAKPTSKRKDSGSDEQVEELQKELLEALDRLEKLDVET